MTTHTEASTLTGFILQDAKAIKNNIIFEVTLGNIDWIAPEIEKFKTDGYSVDMHVMAVHESLSRLGLFQRFEKSIALDDPNDPPRLVPVSYHDQAYQALPDNVEKLELNSPLDIVTVNSRSGTILYRRDNQDGAPNAKAAIILERSRAWLQEERLQHLKDWQDVLKTATSRSEGPLKPAFYIAAIRQAALLAAGYPHITLSAPAAEQDGMLEQQRYCNTPKSP